MPVGTLNIHIGLPKCGSTTLQRSFAKSDAAFYLGKAPFVNDTIRLFTREVAPLCDIRMLNKQYYANEFHRLFASSDKTVALLSDEALSSIGFVAAGAGNSVAQIIENFRSVINCRIEVFIVVREQFNFLQSYYKFILRNRHILSYNEFLSLVMLSEQRWLYPVLDYANIIGAIEPLVDKVHVIPFETLFFDKGAADVFLQKLGVHDVLDSFSTSHNNMTEPDEIYAGRVIRERNNDVHRIALRQFTMTNPAILEALRVPHTQASEKTKLAKSLLAPAMHRYERFEANKHDYLEAHEVDFVSTIFSMNSDLEDIFENYFRECNGALVESYPHYDWKNLGYLMRE